MVKNRASFRARFLRVCCLDFPNVNGGVVGVGHLVEEDQVFAVVFSGGV